MTWAQRMKARQTPKQKARADAAIRYQQHKAAMTSNNEPIRKEVKA